MDPCVMPDNIIPFFGCLSPTKIFFKIEVSSDFVKQEYMVHPTKGVRKVKEAHKC